MPRQLMLSFEGAERPEEDAPQTKGRVEEEPTAGPAVAEIAEALRPRVLAYLRQADGRYDSEEDGHRICVEDDKLFAEGTRCLTIAQGKQFLSFGETGFPAVTEFLSPSHLPQTDQADAAVTADSVIAQRFDESGGRVKTCCVKTNDST